MSRFTQYDKTSTYLENISNAKLQRENRINSEMEEMKKDKIEMDKIKNEIEYEEKLDKEKKALMKRKQYEEYMNYIKYKQNQIPEERNDINIKLGGEDRTIKKQNYNEQMDNLCLNPTKNNKVYPQNQFINYSQAGRNYQRGYSHGYNILTGEIFEQKNQIKNQNINVNIKEEPMIKDEYKNEEKETNKSNDKLNEEDYLAYMEYLRQKEMAQQNNMNNKIREEQPYQNEEIYNNMNNDLNHNNNAELNQNNIPYNYEQYNEPPKKSYHVVPQQKENNYNPPQENLRKIANPQINNNYPYHILDTSNSEYYLNKRKNMTSYEDIYKGKEYKINQINKTDKEKKLEKQKEYARILEGQINSKNIYYETMRNLSKNSEPERDRFNTGNNLLFGSMNPYMKIKERNNKLSEIPKDPYSNKNYNINSNNSYLSSNPIVNPGNNYQFNERIRSSERLKNNGNNIIDK